MYFYKRLVSFSVRVVGCMSMMFTYLSLFIEMSLTFDMILWLLESIVGKSPRLSPLQEK